MPKAEKFRSVKAEKLRSITAGRLRECSAEDFRDITGEELEELCEAPGDLGCAERLPTGQPGIRD